MTKYSNYIPDRNRFNLSGPPDSWLERLREFDESLVVIPSRQEFLYRLCQRRPPDLKTEVIRESLSKDRDAQMMASYGLIPVTTILATANWDNPLMWKDLADRAPHRHGGADAYEKKLLAHEREQRQKIERDQYNRNTDVIDEAWKYYQIKLGTRMGLAGGKTANRTPVPASKSPMLRILGPNGKPISTRL